MWPFSAGCDEADSCTATNPHAITASTLIALVPFAAIFTVVNLLVVRHIYPQLNHSHSHSRDGEDHVLPSHAPASLRAVHAEHGAKSWTRQGTAWTFGTTVALAATLGALVMAEIVEVVNPVARELGVRITVPGLLALLVVIVPWLECRSVVRGMGWAFQRSARGKLPRVAWGLQIALFGGWMFAFWSVGSVVPTQLTRSVPGEEVGMPEMLTKACLERVGVVGIALMALLSGFASVSAPWHTLGDASSRRKRPVTEADVNRKQAGVEATNEMLLTKRHRLQALERKLADPQTGPKSSGGFVGRMMGSIKGPSGDEAEVRSLRVEISGLETMEANLSSNLALMKGQRAATVRASTAMGRVLLVPSYIFSGYCLYRILATILTTLRRASSPSASFASSDPINRFLGLLARHWDPKLDQLAWARTISFALSGVMLLASFNSVLQTFHLFAKWTPGLLRHAQANLALATGQIAATYVISTTMLLRSQLPGEVGSAVGGEVLRGALGGAGFVDGWFEGWFLVGAGITGVGVWVGRKLGGEEWEWDDLGGEEMGAKRM